MSEKRIEGNLYVVIGFISSKNSKGNLQGWDRVQGKFLL